jgi:hypothetical protein
MWSKSAMCKNRFRPIEAKELLKMAEEARDRLVTILPSEVDLKQNSALSRAAGKANLLRAGLLHRTADLSETAIRLCAESRPLPALLMIRAVFETIAIYHHFHEQINEVVRSANGDDIIHCIDKLVHGLGRDGCEGPEAVDVVTAIDELARLIKGVRMIYDDLTEIAHPNWTGTALHYSGVGPYCAPVLTFARSHTWLPLKGGLYLLPVLLDGIVELDDSLGDILTKLATVHEGGGRNRAH